MDPTTAIGYIIAQSNGAEVQGTCAWISPRHVLTASHVIYDQNGNLNSNIQVSVGLPPLLGGDPSTQIFNAVTAHGNPTHDANDQEPLSAMLSDYAVIYLDQTFVGPVFGLYISSPPFYPPITMYGHPGGQPLESEVISVPQLLSGSSAVFVAPLGQDGPGGSGGPAVVSQSLNGVNVLSILGTFDTFVATTSTAYINGFTSADVAQIDSWLQQDGMSQTIDRLYRACLGRPSDPAGLAYWCASGWNFTQIAEAFLNSTEKGTPPSNQDFLNMLYNNVLLRVPDQSGSAYWLSQLNSGPATQAEVAAMFVTSDEAVNCYGYWSQK